MFRILLVEDEKMIRTGLTYLVDWAALNCSVVGECEDGQEGVEAIRRLRPDIIITDVRMPLMDGIEMLQEVKDLYHFKSIILSSYDEFEYATKAIRLEVSDYLLKPIDVEKLQETIRRVTHRLEADQEREQMLKQVQEREILDGKWLRPMPDTEGSLVLQAVQYICEHYQEPLHSESLCRVLQVSKSSLNQRFKEGTGYTVREFLNRYRINAAIQLMKSSRMSLSEIATHIGYSEYKYFLEVFRKYVGQSPRKFLSKHKSL